jgi:hypothetical protein
MKKSVKILLLFVFVLTSLSTYAWKAKSDTTLYAGVWGGPSYAKITGYSGSTPLWGRSWGLQLCYQPNREISIKTGFGLIQKGFFSELEYFDVYNNSIGYYSTAYAFNYLNIPLGFSYNLGRNKFNIYLSAGFDIDLLLKQRTYAVNLPTSVSGNDVIGLDRENTDTYKLLNLGVYIGGGLEYRIKPNIIVFADSKYMHGLNNILAVNSIYNIKQRPLVFSIGIKFGIPVTYSVL